MSVGWAAHLERRDSVPPIAKTAQNSTNKTTHDWKENTLEPEEAVTEEAFRIAKDSMEIPKHIIGVPRFRKTKFREIQKVTFGAMRLTVYRYSYLSLPAPRKRHPFTVNQVGANQC